MKKFKNFVSFFKFQYQTFINNQKPKKMKLFNLKKLLVLSICISGLFFFQSCEKDETPAPANTIDNAEFKAEMRYLWSEHATWTRDVIIGLLDQTADANDDLARLLKNQVQIGDAIKPYYGDAAGQALTDLLTEHIVVAGDILIAARSGDTRGMNEAVAKWYQNGDDMAVFLNSANPENWTIEHMKEHMKNHLDLTLAEAVAHLEGRHDDEVEVYDKVFEQLMHMADSIADGIAKQFPDKF
ncbi:MAG: hypothetical protein RBR28_15015 [Lentimicrobium sp.]|jgi:hypothetical protein|nr:hypothetical protein [Lentimicrobium sp.]